MPVEEPTLCPYCGTGCGLRVTTDKHRVTRIAGDPDHPVNRGRTCRKPLELAHAVHAPDRALHPQVRPDRDNRFQRRSWADALDHVAGRLRAIVDNNGPDAVAFYISGQLLTEDYYAVNKLAKGFLGTNNVDSNSRLCMSSAVAGYTGAFGHDGPPPAYADLDAADCLLLLGSNTAACHPILWGRITDRMAQGATTIVCDPRRTPTAEAATLHLPVRPGADLPLLNALLHVLAQEGFVDEGFVRDRTTGFEEALAVARAWPPERAEPVTGVPAADIRRAARLFGSAETAMTLWSMGANQSAVGTAKNRALINLCLATGNLGRPGAGPLSLTGQPNAMGGRETGGLAHLLPGYRHVADAADRAQVAAHWGVPDLPAHPGLTATELVDALREGTVKAVLVAATNPLVSLPDGHAVRAAFERAELLVVQDCHAPTETSALAHVQLPAAAWPEKDGVMTNSERRMGLVRALVPAPGEAWPDWRIYAGLAERLGYGDAFAWPDAAAVFDEFAALTAGRPCDVSGVDHARLRREGSVQWPAPPGGPGTVRLDPATAAFAPTPHAPPADRTGDAYPLRLTTGRLPDQWHTMTRTGRSAKLRSTSENALTVHPLDAPVPDGAPVRAVSRRGRAAFVARHDDTLPRGVVFAPFHFGALHAEPGAGQLNATAHATVDPVSKQPELKAIAVRLEPVGDAAPARGGTGRRCVVVGSGKAGVAAAEALLRHDPAWRVTILGEEPVAPYDRIQLSKLLVPGADPAALDLQALDGVDLRAGVPAVALDTRARTVTDGAGDVHAYDALVLATGSRAVRPPLEHGEPLLVFRTRADVEAMEARIAAGARRAVVLGGGLLGLEAAAGLCERGLHVTVAERGPHLMGRQLDPAGASLVHRELRERGVEVLTDVSAVRLARRAVTAGGPVPRAHDPVEVVLDDGRRVLADLVVAAAGVQPEVGLARAAGIATSRGILVDDAMRAGAPRVWAVGECAEHRDTVYGLWAPLLQQARVAGAAIAGDPAGFHGVVEATTLKVAGVDCYAGGVVSARADQDEVAVRDTRSRSYRKLVLDGDRLVGAILVGDLALARACTAALRGEGPVPELLGDPVDAAEDPATTVCTCNDVRLGAIDAAIDADGLSEVAEVAAATGATTGCGGCTVDVRERLARHAAAAATA